MLFRSAVWRGPPGLVQLNALAITGESLFKRLSQKSVTLNMMASGSPRFSEEARQRTAQITLEAETYSAGVAHVVLLPGLAGLTVRTFLRTVALLSSGTRRPVKTFSELEPAATWVLQTLAPDTRVGHQELLDCARTLLAR